MGIRKPGYQWSTSRPLSRREQGLIIDSANTQIRAGQGISVSSINESVEVTNSLPHRSALCRVMTQAEVTAESFIEDFSLSGNPNWKIAGANTKKHWDGVALVDDPSQSVWCRPLSTPAEEDGVTPLLVFLPMGGGVVDNDKVFAVYDYATGRWAGVASPGPYAAKTKLPGPFAVNTSADVRLYNKGVDTGVDLEVHLDWMHNGEAITGEKEVIVMYFPMEDRWRIIGAECEA